HHDYDLWLVTAGHGRGVVSGSQFVVRPGSLIMFRPGDTGWVVQDPNDRLTVTFAHFTFVHPGTSDPTVVPTGWLPSRQLELGDVRAVHDPLLSVVRLLEQAEPLAALEARLILAQVVVNIYRQDAAAHGNTQTNADPRVQQVMRYVRDRPSERPTMAEAASLVRLSPAHLRRLFAREVGMSYRSFLVHARMVKARHLLEESTMTVGEIARNLGYSDVVLFSRQIWAYYRLSPTQLRRSAMPASARLGPQHHSRS
ncbi:MAG TPA: AraC family transcriptional regulator, partial [Actinopolymorphaceae bacterium]|nr:AraC family transcriptional regulator [Actinopolymorphaceae bacterium]